MTTLPASRSVSERVVFVTRDADLAVAQVAARRFAVAAGLPARACWEFAIAVSEAVTNVLKYGGGGEVRFREWLGGERCVEFEALDRGQGIHDLGRALQDGVSENRTVAERETIEQRRGLGLGLGSIRRLMDEIEVVPRDGGGTVVRARKYLP